MHDKFEQYVFAQQLDNLAKKLGSQSWLKTKLAEWICEDGFIELGISIPEYDEDASKTSKRNSPLSKFADGGSWNKRRQIFKPKTCALQF